MKHGLVLFVVAALASGGALAADVYRWVDAEGKVHYGQQVPPDAQNPTRVVVPSPSTPPPADAAPTAPGAIPPAADVPADELEAEKKALTRQKCEQARAQLKKYDEARFMLTKDANGQERRATAEEEAAERVRVKREIAANCGG